MIKTIVGAGVLIYGLTTLALISMLAFRSGNVFAAFLAISTFACAYAAQTCYWSSYQHTEHGQTHRAANAQRWGGAFHATCVLLAVITLFWSIVKGF